MFIDVKKAHLIPRCEEDVYVELPEEAKCQGNECGKLVHWLYGCRKAGQAWEDHYAGVLTRAGFNRGRASPVSFYHPGRELWCVVHGDDFTFKGHDDDLDFAAGILREEYELKIRGRLGSGPGDCKEMDILGRIIKLESRGCTWQADPRHRKLVIEHFGFNERTKALTTTGNKSTSKEEEQDEILLTKLEATQFRAVTARLNSLALDCPNIQFATKEISREMSSPTTKSHEKLKRLARYLLSFLAVKLYYRWQCDSGITLDVHTDSDWAGCVRTRRSTSGGSIQLGRHTLRTWSSTQRTVAMSSAEAEIMHSSSMECNEVLVFRRCWRNLELRSKW